jgi:hypothetical protein
LPGNEDLCFAVQNYVKVKWRQTGGFAFVDYQIAVKRVVTGLGKKIAGTRKGKQDHTDADYKDSV